MDPEADEEKIYQCYDQTLTSWQDDGQWWNMLLTAQAGDVLFGTCSNYLGGECAWTATFQGGDNGSLSGISINTSSNEPGGATFTSGMNLSDVFNGSYIWGSAARGDRTPSSVEWIGFYRPSNEPGKVGAPTDWFIRSGYSMTQGAGNANVSTITEEGVAAVTGAVAADVCAGFWLSLACGGVGWVFGTSVTDALDIQSSDYHYQVGPVYFNFQCTNCSSPDGRTYMLEHTSYGY